MKIKRKSSSKQTQYQIHSKQRKPKITCINIDSKRPHIDSPTHKSQRHSKGQKDNKAVLSSIQIELHRITGRVHSSDNIKRSINEVSDKLEVMNRMFKINIAQTHQYNEAYCFTNSNHLLNNFIFN